MLIYLASPYSNVVDKDRYMKKLMAASANYMIDNPGRHLVTPLIGHFMVSEVPTMGGDWTVWKNYSLDLLRRCDVVFWIDLGDNVASTGMRAELELAHALNIPT